MRQALLVPVMLAALFSFPQQSAQPQSGAQPAQTPPQSVPPQSVAQPVQTLAKGCLAVKPIGSHAFRNIMLFGVAGALVSKHQYQVVDAINYPARVGQKFHGNDLQTVASNGTRVVILDKHYTAEDLHKACQ